MLQTMDYDFPPYRPPNEASSILIRVTRGCPWNRCKFCEMYKGTRFEAKPLDEIQRDVLQARDLFGPGRTIFIGDSDSLVIKHIVEAVDFIREVFPEAQRVTSYTRARTVKNLPIELLRRLRDSGLDRLHMGLESGDARVLDLMCKGATPDIMIEGGCKAKRAGFEVSEYVLSGAGGPERWREHAVGSARVLNEIGPDFIRLRTLTLQRGAPLWSMWKRGGFSFTPPIDRLRELALFISDLEVKGCELHSDHMTNYLWAGDHLVYQGVSGRLPEDKEGMLELVEDAIATIARNGAKVVDSNDLYLSGRMVGL